MKNTLFILLFINSLSVFSQSQTEMNQNSFSDFKAVDTELNILYQKILYAYKDEPIFIEKLKSSQRLWVKLRDANLEMKFPEVDKRIYYGSMYPTCENSFLSKMTNERINYLKNWLQSTRKGEGCQGSIKNNF